MSDPVLPCEQRWLDRIFLKLLEGRRLIIQGLPRSGKSVLAGLLTDEIGPSAVIASGRHFTESAQASERQCLLDQLQATVAEHGAAQLVFDDYHLALSRTQGFRLQSQLTALLVDSRRGSDVGALFLARWAGPIDVPGRGSPLVSRCGRGDLPTWGDDDLSHLELDVTSRGALAEVGSLASFLKMCAPTENGLDTRLLERQLETDTESILNDVTAEGVEFLAGLRSASDLSQAHRAPVNALIDSTSGHISGAAKRSGLHVGASQRGAAWASPSLDGAAVFAHLTEGHDHVLWCDRYLFADLSALSQFLSELRQVSASRIRLLGARRLADRTVDAAALRTTTQRHTGVEARFISGSDYSGLHDRHLVLSGGGGYVLPTCRVVMGLDPSGSAVRTRTSRFGIDYESCWKRSMSVSGG